jgi:hypothetical protein
MTRRACQNWRRLDIRAIPDKPMRRTDDDVRSEVKRDRSYHARWVTYLDLLKELFKSKKMSRVAGRIHDRLKTLMF